MKKVISTSNAPAAIGPYSQAVAAGNLLFMSGQLGIDPATGEFAAGGVKEQTEHNTFLKSFFYFSQKFILYIYDNGEFLF